MYTNLLHGRVPTFFALLFDIFLDLIGLLPQRIEVIGLGRHSLVDQVVTSSSVGPASAKFLFFLFLRFFFLTISRVLYVFTLQLISQISGPLLGATEGEPSSLFSF